MYIHTMENYSAIKDNEILPFALIQMELECIMVSKISQRKIQYDFTHIVIGIEETKQMNTEKKGGKPYNRYLSIENKLRVDGGRWRGWGVGNGLKE